MKVSKFFCMILVLFSISAKAEATEDVNQGSPDTALGDLIITSEDNSAYRFQLKTLSAQQIKDASDEQLIAEYGIKFTELTSTCLPDGLKALAVGIIESVPGVSILAWVPEFAHVDEKRSADYGGTQNSYDGVWPTSSATDMNGILGGALTSVFGNPEQRHYAYMITRTFLHDSFDPKYKSLCTEAASSIQAISQELDTRQKK